MAELHVTEDCISCESCAEICPAVFKMDAATGRAKVARPPQPAEPWVDEAIAICPVQAIVWE